MAVLSFDESRAGDLWERALPQLDLHPGSRVLAIAMGTAPILARLLRQGTALTACDWHLTGLRGAMAAGLASDSVIAWDETEAPPLPADFDVACCDLGLLPSRAAFADAVRCALAHLRPGGRLLVCGGRTEGVGGAATRLRQWTGAADVLAYGRGRRILQAPAVGAGAVPPPAPAWEGEIACGGEALRLRSAEAVFARGLPDAAALLLCSALASWPGAAAARTACDVGCGGGALGLCLLRRGVRGCTGVDDNLRALAASRHNARLNGLQERWRTVAADLRAGAPGGPYDVVLCNPPLHHGVREDRDLGRAVLAAAWAACARGGRLFVVGHHFLRFERDVPDLQAVASDRAFRVLCATRP